MGNIAGLCVGDSLGMPGPKSVAFVAIVFGASTAHRLLSARQNKMVKSLASEPCVVRFALIYYFAVLVGAMTFFSPERQISTGPHQVFGSCDVEDMDLLGYPRNRYICSERYPDFYFRFDCRKALEGA